VRREVVPEGEVSKERVPGSIGVSVWEAEARSTTQYELAPYVPPELPVWVHCRKTIAVHIGAARDAEAYVERLCEVATL
jgi:hypothetical protein